MITISPLNAQDMAFFIRKRQRRKGFAFVPSMEAELVNKLQRCKTLDEAVRACEDVIDTARFHVVEQFLTNIMTAD